MERALLSFLALEGCDFERKLKAFHGQSTLERLLVCAEGVEERTKILTTKNMLKGMLGEDKPQGFGGLTAAAGGGGGSSVGPGLGGLDGSVGGPESDMDARIAEADLDRVREDAAGPEGEQDEKA